MEKTNLGIHLHPCQVFRAVCHQPDAIFLESQRPSFSERYSFIAWEPEKVFRGDIPDLRKDDFFGFMSSHSHENFVAGYIGYEACQWIEDLRRPGDKDRALPDIYLAAYGRFLVYDHIRKAWSCWSKDSPVSIPACCLEDTRRFPGKLRGFNQTKATYLENVRRVLDYIRAGDVYQINYTQRVYFTCAGELFDLYLRLKEIQPVSYAAFINLGNGVVISGSPELFLGLKHGKILSKPMK